MKNLAILSLSIIVILLAINSTWNSTSAQSYEKERKKIENSSQNIVKWMNEEKTDSILMLYDENASIIPNINGHTEIRHHITFNYTLELKIISFETLSLEINGNLAVQKYRVSFVYGGKKYSQKGLTEWHKKNKNWIIKNDVFVYE